MSDFELSFNQKEKYWTGSFQAMAGPCEILIDNPDKSLATQATSIAHAEAKRIEKKFSRYRDDNIVFKINHANGQAVEVDEETAKLLDYAQECHLISDGLFDITSGVLREVWKFNGSNQIPSEEQVNKIIKHVGWNLINWQKPLLTLKPNMEIDFGGIGKEYAVDRSAMLIASQTEFKHILVNYGGDLNALGPRASGDAWEVGLQDPSGNPNSINAKIELYHGAVTTSGDLHKFLEKDGVRYGHILNPKTGWPTPNSPRQVTVLGSTCIEAGILSTLAILQGSEAETFLEVQEVEFRVIR